MKQDLESNRHRTRLHKQIPSFPGHFDDHCHGHRDWGWFGNVYVISVIKTSFIVICSFTNEWTNKHTFVLLCTDSASGWEGTESCCRRSVSVYGLVVVSLSLFLPNLILLTSNDKFLRFLSFPKRFASWEQAHQWQPKRLSWKILVFKNVHILSSIDLFYQVVKS